MHYIYYIHYMHYITCIIYIKYILHALHAWRRSGRGAARRAALFEEFPGGPWAGAAARHLGSSRAVPGRRTGCRRHINSLVLAQQPPKIIFLTVAPDFIFKPFFIITHEQTAAIAKIIEITIKNYKITKTTYLL